MGFPIGVAWMMISGVGLDDVFWRCGLDMRFLPGVGLEYIFCWRYPSAKKRICIMDRVAAIDIEPNVLLKLSEW